jgi:2-methylcitrate dehydratase PrpD
MDAVRRFAEHVVRTRYEDLSPAAVLATKTFVLDTIGVGIAGSGDAWASRLGECVGAWGAGREAVVWGTGARLPAQLAALVNGYQVHCLEFDCLHDAAVVHPMATLLPALAAHAERRGPVSGKDFVTAVATGVDVAASLGMASRAAMQFFRPATAGAFGAVAAIAKVEGFDVDTLVNAFGIVYGHLSGTLQPHDEGGAVLGMQMGFNARGALTAVDLAASGLVGPHEVLEGRYGYFRLFESGAYDLGPVLGELGRVRRVTELAHKPFPCGRLTHGVVDGVTRLATIHGFRASDVVRVRAIVPPLVQRLVGRPAVPSPAPSYARLCLPFVAAVALVRGTVDVPDFRDARLTEARVHEVARMVEVVSDGAADENAMAPQTIEVTLRDGTRHQIRIDSVIGHPESPLSRRQHLDKFRRCWTYGARPLPPDNAERLTGLVDRLDTSPDARELFGLTTP